MAEELGDPAWRVRAATMARARTRIVGRWPTYPADWKPQTVVSPASDLPMGDREAFEMIACQVESGCPLETLILRQPAGEMAYVLKFRLGSQRLYAKFQLKQMFIGRSFHLDLV